MKISRNVPKMGNKPSPVSTALEHVKCAIDVLGPAAASDVVAREALINLGVIACDLGVAKAQDK